MSAQVNIQVHSSDGEASFLVEADTVHLAVQLASLRAHAAFGVTAASLSGNAPTTAHALPVDPPAAPTPQEAQGVLQEAHDIDPELAAKVRAAAGPGISTKWADDALEHTTEGIARMTGHAMAEHRGRPYDKSTGQPLPPTVQHAVPVEAIRGDPPFAAPVQYQAQDGSGPFDTQAEADAHDARIAAGPQLPVTVQENAGPAPWEVEGVPAPEKKSGRRTNEELAADAGVRLEDVKTWLGEGQRVSKSKIEEFASLHPAAVAMNDQTLDQAAEHLDPSQAAPNNAPGLMSNNLSSPLPEQVDPAVPQDMPVEEMQPEAFGTWSPFGDTPPAPQGPADGPDLPF